MSKFREHLKRCAEIVATWPPWKQRLLENKIPEPLPDHKYIIQLTLDGRRAIVVDWSPEDAKQRALLEDPHGGWVDSEWRIVTRVRRSMTSLVLAMDPPVKTCDTCRWWSKSSSSDSWKMCSCPKMVYGYKARKQGRDELHVEDDEGWGMIPGPKFGCIHHERTP
ncbi:MAG: hypothetical protein ACYS7Y_26915 [Planctomycetota bacterium]|jgi:hypothetical protein